MTDIFENRDTVPFTKEGIMAYLDGAIRHWRKKLREGDGPALYYIDAFQSMRTSVFGETLPEEEE